jgi:hypothetical protein
MGYSDMADHAFYSGLFFVVALAILTWEVLRSRFVAKLRSRVHDVWVSVGSPGGIWRRLVLIDGFQLEGFILRRGYQSLPADLVADGDKLNVAKWSWLSQRSPCLRSSGLSWSGANIDRKDTLEAVYDGARRGDLLSITFASQASTTWPRRG